MKTMLALTIFTMLALAFRSCTSEVFAPGSLPEVKVDGLVRRPIRPSLRHKIYPSADTAKSPFELKQAAVAQMPSTQHVRQATHGDAHFAPPALMDGLESFSKMVDLARSGGENTEVAASFFKQCAQSDATATAVRATCLRHLWDLKGADAEIPAVSYLVRRVAAKLPSILIRQN